MANKQKKEKDVYFIRTCPECTNTKFKMLSVFMKAVGTGAGKYRVQCTVCDFIELAVSKNVYTAPETRHKAGKVGRKPAAE